MDIKTKGHKIPSTTIFKVCRLKSFIAIVKCKLTTVGVQWGLKSVKSNTNLHKIWKSEKIWLQVNLCTSCLTCSAAPANIFKIF